MNPSSIRIAIVLGGALLAASRSAGAQTTRVSVDSSNAQANGESRFAFITPDGRYVAFSSWASNLVAGDTNGQCDVFVRDRSTGITERVSVDSSGMQGNDGSVASSISADGRFVAFTSWASNLVASDTNGNYDAFVHDRSTGLTERVSVDSFGAEANDGSGEPSISADGRFVAFCSGASNLVAGDSNGFYDVFVHDRSTGVTEIVSVDSNGVAANLSSWSGGRSISEDGRLVVFESEASNLVTNDTNGLYDVFVHDRSTGVTSLVSVDSSGIQGNMESEEESISPDGRYVVFASWSTNLVADDTNDNHDVFVHDLSTGLTERVNVSSDGTQANDSTMGQLAPSISADGELVAFDSGSTNLVPDDTNGAWDIFVHHRSTGITERVSVDSAGRQADGYGSFFPSIAVSGEAVVFNSTASNLVPGDTNGFEDVFVHDRDGARWSNYGTGYPGTFGVASFTSQTNPVIGMTITLDLGNSRGEYTVGALFIGVEPTVIHSGWGGDLLVVPLITQLVGLTPWGTSLQGDLPDDESLCGCFVELQAIEADPGAAKGVSFTRGLDLVLGR